MNAGDRIIRVYNGQTTKKWEGLPVGRRIWLREEDCKIVAQNIPQVAVAAPGLGRHLRLKVGDKVASTYMEGVYPEFEFLRRTFHGPGGRFLNEKDLKDIPATVLKAIEIVLVEHMDEVLPHALILEEGDTLFKKHDIPFEMMTEDIDKDQRSALI